MATLIGRLTTRRRLEQETYRYFDRWATSPLNQVAGPVNDFIKTLVHTGLWGKLDYLHLALTTEVDSRVNVVNPGTYDLTPSGTPVFTPYLGFFANAAGYYDTGLNPSTAPNLKHTSTSVTLGAFSERDGAATSSRVMGNTNLNQGLNSATNTWLGRMHSTTNVITYTWPSPPSTKGMYIVSKTAAGSCARYKDGVAVNSGSGGTASVTSANMQFLTFDSGVGYDTNTNGMQFLASGLTAEQVVTMTIAYATLRNALDTPV